MERAGGRLGLLDTLRGLAIIQMVLFHFFYDLKYMTGVPMDWYGGRWVYYWQQEILWSFVVISGVSWNLGRRHFRRGLTVFVMGLVITAVTLIVMPEERIFFGVLTFMGTAMLLLIPLDKGLKKAPPRTGAFLCLLFFFLTKGLAEGYLGFWGLRLVSLPKSLYRNWFTTFLGLPVQGFVSSDYVPLFPGFFLFIAGYFLWKILKEEKRMESLLGKEISWLSWLGGKSLWIYMLHQPVVYILALGLDCLMGNVLK